ncbi:arginyl-tRNA--protein transferase 1 isoform X2 [Panulirus ornatus]|uniref:arginyl-tRNA--protein transferase 1 isoform X2 n=1 Tax=Panulirus ornatus TaxID=150431 RepID=UPI003A89B9CF
MAEEKDNSFTIVEYMRDHSGYKCGYCKSKDTNFSHGMWSHQMSVNAYQDLIDRGWRRSGKYCYKPTMDKTCCPMYTIKCDAFNLKLSKSQKKVLKRMHRYLSNGGVKEEKAIGNENSKTAVGNEEYVRPKFESKQDLSSIALCKNDVDMAENVGFTAHDVHGSIKTSLGNEAKKNLSSSKEVIKSASQNLLVIKSQKGSAGPDLNRPPCRKAKDIRRERREAKLAKHAQEVMSRGECPMETKKIKPSSTEKTLEDFLNEPLPENPAHTLEVKLVRSQPSSDEFLQTFKTAHQVYEKYQINIHGDSPDRCSESQFKRFLCNSPLELKLVRINPPEATFRASYNASFAVFRKYQLQIHHDSESECDKMSYQGFLVDGALSPWKPHFGPQYGYGSFHHQYWLDGRLVAVGVLDILPHCLSSVYLYYDPEFSFLSLGTYASLRELALTRELQRRVSSLRWYYMGFYIHSCPKMRYKGKYTPSFLLCPETYVWVPIEDCVPKLEESKYSRLNEDLSATDEDGQVDLSKIPILHEQELIRYGMYHALNPDVDDEEEIKEYAVLVGMKSAYSMFLYRS